MFTLLTKRYRVKAAIALALAYAVCVLASPAAFAFSHGAHAVHCLTGGYGVAPLGGHHSGHPTHAAMPTHGHEGDHATSQHDGHGQWPDCCGLFSVLALSAPTAVVPNPFVHASDVSRALDHALSGRTPERINRPPIA